MIRNMSLKMPMDIGSLMLSVADIPLAGLYFTGIIGVVF